MKNKVIYFCLKCHQESSYKDYWQNLTSEYSSICQKCDDGKLVALDFKIQPIIKKLLNKNYITQFSCSGHVGDNFSGFPYISFYHSIEKISYPKNWTLDSMRNSLYAKIKNKPTEQAIDSLMNELDEWVDSVPVNTGNYSDLICSEKKEVLIKGRRRKNLQLILINENHEVNNQMTLLTEDLNLESLESEKVYAKVNKTLDVLNLNNLGWGILNNPTPALMKKYRDLFNNCEIFVWDDKESQIVRIS